MKDPGAGVFAGLIAVNSAAIGNVWLLIPAAYFAALSVFHGPALKSLREAS